MSDPVFTSHRAAEEEAAGNAGKLEPEYDEDGQIIEKPADAPVWRVPVNPNPPLPEEEPAPKSPGM